MQFVHRDLQRLPTFGVWTFLCCCIGGSDDQVTCSDSVSIVVAAFVSVDAVIKLPHFTLLWMRHTGLIINDISLQLGRVITL